MLQENLLFIILSTAFLFITGWYWRDAKPYSLPQPIPNWFKAWFVTVQILETVPKINIKLSSTAS